MRIRRTTLVIVAAAAVAIGGCGEDDFENKPRPAKPIVLTGVIQQDGVTVSPRKVGAGPILITISNQTDEAHSVTLEGESVKETLPDINPLDTGTIQKTLEPGSYEVKAGSSAAVAREIAPAILTIGPPRKNSSDELLLP